MRGSSPTAQSSLDKRTGRAASAEEPEPGPAASRCARFRERGDFSL
jgi:hypothetical protein